MGKKLHSLSFHYIDKMAALTLMMFAVLWAMGTATIHWDAKLINNSRPFDNGTEIELPANHTYLNTFCPSGTGKITVQCYDEKNETFQVYRNDTANHYVATCDPWKGLVCNNTKANATCPDFYLQYGCDKPDLGRNNSTQTKPTTPSKGGNGNSVSITHGTVVSTTSTQPTRPQGGGSTPVPSGNDTGKSSAHATYLSTGSTPSNPPPGGSLGRRCTCNGGDHVVINKKLVSLIPILCLIKRLVY